MRGSAELPWKLAPNGLVVSVRLTPKSGRDEIAGIEQRADGMPVLKVRVRAVAAKDEANKALTRLIADALDVAPRNVSLLAGATARIKRLMIEGDANALANVLQRIVGGKRNARKDH